MGLEGKIGETKVIIATPGMPVTDTLIEGNETISEVNGVSATAGYFITKANSQGVKNIIFFASLTLGDATIYVEPFDFFVQSIDIDPIWLRNSLSGHRQDGVFRAPRPQLHGCGGENLLRCRDLSVAMWKTTETGKRFLCLTYFFSAWSVFSPTSVPRWSIR
ncbi:hypothetical protein LQZ18_13440 [Lachnospiraceae bacterium ZAX-1]